MPPPDLSRREFIGASAALGGLIALHPFSARAQAGQVHLRILSTTDLHCHVQPYDYYADKPTDTVGLSRTAIVIEAIRAEATNTLLVDNGDYLQGNPMGDYIAYERGMQPGDLHPVIAGMNTLAYEAGTLGNHEFNYGVEFLDLVNAGATFPIVCANFARTLGPSPRGDALHLEPYVLLDRTVVDGAGTPRAIRIGLIGFVPPQIMLWDRGHLEGRFAVRDILEAARAWVPEMREAGADVVVALSHSGIAPGPDAAMLENASFQLAGVEGIDAIVTGHQHLVWPGEDFAGDGLDPVTGAIRGKPAAMAGFWGSHMGLIDLLLEHDGGAWRVASFETSARPIYQRKEDRSVTALVGDYAPPLEATAAVHEATLAYVRAEVGQTTAPLQSYFAVVADDPSVQIVSQAQTWYVTELHEGHRMGGPAGALGGGTVQVGRPRRAGLLHRRRGRAGRDQERGGRLPLPEHAAGGGDHRRAGRGLAGAVGGHLPAGRARQGRPAADRPGLPSLQFRRDRRGHLRDRRDPAVALRRRGRIPEPRGEPHRRPAPERRAARPRGEGGGRDQQLPRRRRRQLPRRRRLDGDPGRARHQPRRDRPLHRRAGHDLAGLGRQLAPRAGRGRHRDLRHRPGLVRRTSPTCRAAASPSSRRATPPTASCATGSRSDGNLFARVHRWHMLRAWVVHEVCI